MNYVIYTIVGKKDGDFKSIKVSQIMCILQLIGRQCVLLYDLINSMGKI